MLAERARACQHTLQSISTLGCAFGAAGVAVVEFPTRIEDAERTDPSDFGYG